MKILILLFTLFLFIDISSQEAGKVLPLWKEGEMEIHHIYTGRGECVFCIFPDGTTMLIDAGDVGPYLDPRTTHGSPDETRRAGEWNARYILNRLGFPKEKLIDYFLLTHFHGDHMGTIDEKSPGTSRGGNYFLSGLTEVGEFLHFNKLVDRDWPTYKYPKPQEGRTFQNYLDYVKWNVENTGMKIERFVPGSDKQFTLVHQPEKYKNDFEVRNIVSNGEVWTGVGNQTRNYFPRDLPQGESIDENKLSAGIRDL